MCTIINIRCDHLQRQGFTLKRDDVEEVVLRPGMRIPVLQFDWENIREENGAVVPSFKRSLAVWGVPGFNQGDVIPNARADKAFYALRMGRGFWAGYELGFIPLSSFTEKGYTFKPSDNGALLWLALHKNGNVAGVTTEAIEPVARITARMPLLHTQAPSATPDSSDYLVQLFQPAHVQLSVDGPISFGSELQMDI